MKNKVHFNYEKENLKTAVDFGENANFFIRLQRKSMGFHFTLDRPSLVKTTKWLKEQVHQAERENYDQRAIFTICLMIGSYFGECLKRKYGGQYELMTLNDNSKFKAWMLNTSVPSGVSIPVFLPIENIFNGDKDVEDLLAIYDNVHLIHKKIHQGVTSNPLRYL
jgi:hypothetical protein